MDGILFVRSAALTGRLRLEGPAEIACRSVYESFLDFVGGMRVEEVLLLAGEGKAATLTADFYERWLEADDNRVRREFAKEVDWQVDHPAFTAAIAGWEEYRLVICIPDTSVYDSQWDWVPRLALGKPRSWQLTYQVPEESGGALYICQNPTPGQWEIRPQGR